MKRPDHESMIDITCPVNEFVSAIACPRCGSGEFSIEKVKVNENKASINLGEN